MGLYMAHPPQIRTVSGEISLKLRLSLSLPQIKESGQAPGVLARLNAPRAKPGGAVSGGELVRGSS